MNLDKLAGYSLQFMFWCIVDLFWLWFLGVGLSAGIVLTNSFDFIVDQEVVGLVVLLITLFLPFTLASYFMLKESYKKVKKNE